MTKQDIKNLAFNKAWSQVEMTTIDIKRVKNEIRNNNIGFIAQDVQEVIPELVNESILLNGKEGETKLGVEYNKMIAVLTNAIQEQQKQIEELKKLINGNTK